MKEACTDVKQDKAFRVCTNRTTAGFFYNKEIFEELGIRDFPTQWGDFVEMLEKINELGIGPQGFGGRTTAIGLNIETMPTHIAGMPCAVNINCHVTRHKSEVI